MPRGGVISLKAEEKDLVIAALSHYQAHLLEKYDDEEESQEYQLDTALDIRNLLEDKLTKK